MNVLDFTPDINPDIPLNKVFVLNEDPTAHAKGIDFNALAHPTEKRIIPIYSGVKYVMMLPIGVAFLESQNKYKLFYKLEDVVRAYNELVRNKITPYIADEDGNKIIVREPKDNDKRSPLPCMDSAVVLDEQVFDKVLYQTKGVKPDVRLTIKDAQHPDSAIIKDYYVDESASCHLDDYDSESTFLNTETGVNCNSKALAYEIVRLVKAEVPRISQEFRLVQELFTALHDTFQEDLKRVIHPKLSEGGVDTQKLTLMVLGLIIEITVDFITSCRKTTP